MDVIIKKGIAGSCRTWQYILSFVIKIVIIVLSSTMINISITKLRITALETANRFSFRANLITMLKYYCHFQNCWHCRTMRTFWAIYSHNFKLIVSPSNQVRFTWFFNGNLSISLPTGHGNNNWEFWLLIGCFGLGTCARTLMNYNIQMGSSFIFR